MDDRLLSRETIGAAVIEALAAQPVTDMHTHLYPPGFGTPVPNASGATDPAGMMLWGLDELLTYHYLVAEVFRVAPATELPYETFWTWSKRAQADHIWKHLFVDRTPLSEACRGVLTTLQKLGLDPNERSLDPYRRFFDQQDPSGYIDRVMELSNVSSITMTNPVFDEKERNRWLSKPAACIDSRFRAVLRIDPLLRNYGDAARQMSAWGYRTQHKMRGNTIEEARRFLRDWIDRQKAIYLATSLPPEFRYPADERDATAFAGQLMLENVVLPVCEERGLPLAMMIGSDLQVNPSLRDAGDMVGKADVGAVTHLCRQFPGNKFLVTMLSRENQHELCVAARKFGNLMVFGCWWFLNNPSMIAEIERMRLELLGTSFIPQHSDARVLDQLLYKWDHSRAVLAKVLTDQYRGLLDTGRRLTRDDICRDAKAFLAGNFQAFLSR